MIDSAEAMFHRAIKLLSEKNYEASKALLEETLRLAGPRESILHNLGIVCLELSILTEAKKYFDSVIIKNPTSFDSKVGRAVCDYRLGNKRGAIFELFELIPDSIEAAFNLLKIAEDDSNLVQKDEIFSKALSKYKIDGRLKRKYALYLRERGDYRACLSLLCEIYEDDPSVDLLLGDLINLKRTLCDWQNEEILVRDLLAKIHDNKLPSNPFNLLSIVDSPSDQLKITNTFTGKYYNLCRRPVVMKEPSGKIKIGYYSCDFHNHAVMNLFVEALELHDSDIFEIHCFYHGRRMDFMTERIKSGFCVFHNVSERRSSEIRDLSMEIGIDLAVDLAGHTGENKKNDLFETRFSLIQVNFLGYPGTGGLLHDYIIADKYLVPNENEKYYTEKVFKLDICYQPNPSLQSVGLPLCANRPLNSGENFVVACFNQPYKITSEIFNAWIHILQASPRAELRLLIDNEEAKLNLRSLLDSKGIAASRVLFLDRCDRIAHLRRHADIHLFLDTHPYNAHTTASDALRCGVPLITLAGSSFASRVGGSLLYHLGLEDLVVDSIESYVNLAISLSTDVCRYERIRERLIQGLLDSDCFKPEAYIRHLESAYTSMLSSARRS